MKCISEAEHAELVAARSERDRLAALLDDHIERSKVELRMVPWPDRLIYRATRRPPDFVIGGGERPYLRRWWLTPWRRWAARAEADPTRWNRLLGRISDWLPNVYLHQFLRSDDDRALHDHPWANASLLLRGCYVEHTIAAGGIHERHWLQAGDWRIRWSGRLAHRVELTRAIAIVDGQTVNVGDELPCWTLFITGPRYRQWGFHCEHGWVHWRQFTATHDRGSVGKGCDA